MDHYLPEGMDLRRHGFTPELLRKAKAEGTVLQAPAVVCTEDHDLLVDLGCATGCVPREETAIGIREGSVREIAVLSRGKSHQFLCHRLSALRPGPPFQASGSGTGKKSSV